MTGPRTVLLVDDHPLFREGLKALVAGNPGYAVVGEAGDADEALRLAREHKPDVALLDIALPGKSGLDVLRQLDKRQPETRVLIVSMHAKIDLIAECFRAGAAGYIVKESTASQLWQGLEAVCRGERYLDSAVAPMVLVKLGEYAARRSRPQDPAYGALTRREQQVLRLLAEGRDTAAIAAMLFISRKTVENHRAHIFGKLGLRNLAELVHYAARLGLVELDPEASAD
jgi:DNA-binding NarL/FixJ family response regulator